MIRLWLKYRDTGCSDALFVYGVSFSYDRCFIDAVGAIMVVAMLIAPAASAYLWTDKLSVMLILSGMFGVSAAFTGYVIAAWLDTSISGSMAFATGIFFTVSFIFSPKHGVIAKAVKPAV